MSITFDSALGIHAEALKVRARRAELIAANLANADTPNYKARDIDFKAAMKMATTSSQSSLTVTHRQHIPATASIMPSPTVQFRIPMQDALDGNTVDEQMEQSAFMQNAVQYQASLTFLGGKFKGLMTAIKGE